MNLAAKNAKSAKKTWPMVRLGDVCIVQRGVRVTRKDLDDNGKYNVYQNSLKPLGKYNSFNCEARSPFMIMALAAGEPGFSEEPFWAADDCTYFKDLKGLDNQYLYFLLSVNKDELKRNVKQTTIPRLSNKFLENLEFPLPPLSVQREIVARLEKELGEADALAAKFKEIAENADAEFKAELDETFKNVEGEKVRLGDVCGFLTDGDWIESKDQSENGVRLIQTGNVGIGVFKAKESNAHYISEETFERLKCTEIFNGDVLVSRLPSPVGRACIVNGIEGRMITAVDCSIIRFKDVVVKEYFVAYSQTQGYQAAIDVLTTGTTRARISRKNLASIPVPLLPLSVQREIITKLDAARERCDKLKAAAERGLRAAEDLRKAILTEAFEQ